MDDDELVDAEVVVEEGILPDRATLPPSQLRRERVVPQSTAKRPRTLIPPWNQ